MIDAIGVIGAGFMGAGIAQLAAQSGFQVRLFDADASRGHQARNQIEAFVRKLAAKGELDDSFEDVLKRLALVESLAEAADAPLIIEVIPERVELKQALFQELDRVAPPHAILASNTSTIPIRVLAEATQRPAQIIGTHFFFPVPLNPLLEIVPSEKTAPETVAAIVSMGGRMRKHCVVVKKDIPGFIMNRIFAAMTCEAIRLIESGAATVADIDGGLVAGYGMIQGPLAKADMAGLDVCLLAFSTIHRLDPASGIEPPQLLHRLVGEGRFGRKSGRGFYYYDDQGRNLGPVEFV